MTLTYISTHLNTHEKCVKYLEQKRWKGTPVCPYCKSRKSSPKRLRHTCLKCKNSYSVTVGTFMENSNLPLNKWLMAIAIMLTAKKGISSMQLSRDLSVNKNTAWLLQMKIRAAMSEGKLERFKPKNLSESSHNVDTSLKKYCGHFQERNVFGYWSIFKRAIIGQYHKLASHYVTRYIDEIDFKFARKHLNNRGYSELIDRMLFHGAAK